MAGITRFTLTLFGGQGPATSFGIFGSKTQNGTGQTSQNPATIQSISAAWTQGWQNAIVNSDKAAYLEDMNGWCFVHSSALAYLFQMGVAEYDPGTTYFNGSIVYVASTQQLFVSQAGGVAGSGAGQKGNAPPTSASNSLWKWMNPPQMQLSSTISTNYLPVSAGASADSPASSYVFSQSHVYDNGATVGVTLPLTFPDSTVQSSAGVSAATAQGYANTAQSNAEAASDPRGSAAAAQAASDPAGSAAAAQSNAEAFAAAQAASALASANGYTNSVIPAQPTTSAYYAHGSYTYNPPAGCQQLRVRVFGGGGGGGGGAGNGASGGLSSMSNGSATNTATGGNGGLQAVVGGSGGSVGNAFGYVPLGFSGAGGGNGGTGNSAPTGNGGSTPFGGGGQGGYFNAASGTAGAVGSGSGGGGGATVSNGANGGGGGAGGYLEFIVRLPLASSYTIIVGQGGAGGGGSAGVQGSGGAGGDGSVIIDELY